MAFYTARPRYYTILEGIDIMAAFTACLLHCKVLYHDSHKQRISQRAKTCLLLKLTWKASLVDDILADERRLVSRWGRHVHTYKAQV